MSNRGQTIVGVVIAIQAIALMALGIQNISQRALEPPAHDNALDECLTGWKGTIKVLNESTDRLNEALKQEPFLSPDYNENMTQEEATQFLEKLRKKGDK